jgi:periplasmic divalent cation tolerance protein
MSADVQLVLCTCPDETTAETLAEGLVGTGLAACANIVPGLVSIYRWEDQVEQADEVLMLIKTTTARLADLTAYIEQQHPYDVPEVIASPIVAGLPAYLDWVRTCTTTSND